MMRSPGFFSVACRAPNGAIVRKTEPIEKTWIGRQKWLQKPFLRGTFALLDGMALGIRAMRFAGDVQVKPEYQTEESQKALGAAPKKGVQEVAVAGAMIGGLALGFFVFNIMPNAIAELLGRNRNASGLAINYISETLKVIFFIGYIWAISFLPDIRNLFRYHGAEHKAINAMEASEPLDLSHAGAQTRIHPRCGTSFAVIVLIVGFLLTPLVPRYPITGSAGNWLQDVPVRVFLELLILPIIAGISYELLRIAGKMRNEKWVNVAFAPGMWTQRITTQEPDQGHLEVALAALHGVVDAEEGKPVAEQIEIVASPSKA